LNRREASPQAGAPGLGKRERRVLKSIIEGYIRSGEPVGSQAIAPGCEVSSATVRNVMSELEGQGLLEKAHTSSGRRPTEAGYRYYVSSLLTLKEPPPEQRDRILRSCSESGEVSGCLHEASRLLHDFSSHAGVVATPKGSSERIHQIDLLRLPDGRLLAVVVTQEGLVHHRLLIGDFPGSAEDLARATATLNGLLRDNTVEAVRERILMELQQKRALFDQLLERVLTLVESALADPSAPEILMSGQSSLLDSKDLDLDRIRILFHALEEKRQLLKILDQAAHARSLQVLIGAEGLLGQASGVALVTFPYGLPGHVLGTVGVIGPTRMDYGRVIPLVRYTARTVSSAMSSLLA
jgi:heat-inducible transcriptional repressor